MEDNEIKKELKILKPFERELRAQRESNLPAKYFDRLSNDILTKTSNIGKQKTKRKPLFNTWKVAASIAILVGISYIFSTALNKPVAQTATLSMDDLSTMEILDYIENNSADFSDEELELFLEDESLEDF